MLERFGNWFNENNTQITWFLIGWLCEAALEALARGNYLIVLLDLAIAWFNYAMWKRNNV